MTAPDSLSRFLILSLMIGPAICILLQRCPCIACAGCTEKELVAMTHPGLCILPRLFAPSATPSSLETSCKAATVSYSFTPINAPAISFQSTWPAVQPSQTSRINGGNLQYQTIKVTFSRFILQMNELIICSEAASRHQ